MLKRALFPVVALGCAITLAAGLWGCSKGCKSGEESRDRPRMTVSVSVFPIYDLVRRVAGPDADVTLMVPPGTSEHAARPEPSPAEVEAASKVRVGILVGLGLDAWMETLLANAAPKARVLKVGDRVPTLTNEADGTPDPHVWLDPERARLIVRAIAEELGKADSAHALAYRKRATEVDASLAALDAEVETRTKAMKTRTFVPFHGAFQYFGERYKLETPAFIGIFRGDEHEGRAHYGRVRDILKAQGIRAVFSEPQSDAYPAKALADEAKISLGVLDALGGGAETDSYEALIRFDVAQLEKLLK